MKGSWGVLFKGLGTTIVLSVSSFFSCILLGLGVAILRRFNNPTLNLFLTAYVDVFRSLPVIVLMVVLFFACPFLGIYLDSILTTFTALTLSYGAYTAETFRAGMGAVSVGQVEAARSLGLSRWKTLTKVVIPQAIPLVIPVADRQHDRHDQGHGHRLHRGHARAPEERARAVHGQDQPHPPGVRGPDFSCRAVASGPYRQSLGKKVR